MMEAGSPLGSEPRVEEVGVPARVCGSGWVVVMAMWLRLGWWERVRIWR